MTETTETTPARSNAHNEKRKARFVAAGVTEADIRFSRAGFVGEGEAECALCDHPIKNLFSLEFARPSGARPRFEPVGSTCITDWIKAMPASPEREAALGRIKEAEKRMRDLKREKEEREAFLSGLDADAARLMRRFDALPDAVREQGDGPLADIAAKVERFGSFRSDRQAGFFARLLKDAERDAGVSRPPTPPTGTPRPTFPIPASTVAAVAAATGRPDLLPAPPASGFPVPACPKCGGPTRLNQSARGPFFGCVNFPNCKCLIPVYVAPAPAPTQLPLPGLDVLDRTVGAIRAADAADAARASAPNYTVPPPPSAERAAAIRDTAARDGAAGRLATGQAPVSLTSAPEDDGDSGLPF